MAMFLPILSTGGVTLVLFALLLVADYLIGEFVPDHRRKAFRHPLLVLLGVALLLCHANPADDVAVDLGGVGLTIAMVFGGVMVGLVTAALQIVCRLAVAGPDSGLGIATILLTLVVVAGLLRWRRRADAALSGGGDPGVADILVFGVAAGATGAVSLLLAPSFVAAGDTAHGMAASLMTLRDIGPGVFSADLVASGLFGGLLFLQGDRHQNQRARAAMALDEEVRSHGLSISGMEFIWKVTADGHILDANDAYLHRFGYTLDQLRRLTLQDIKVMAPGQTTKSVMDAIKAAGVSSDETIHRTSGGDQVPLDVTTIYDADHDYVLAFMRDISERKEAERRLAERGRDLNQALVQAVGALSAVMVHRDMTAAGHEARVRDLALRIGRVLGLDDNRLEGLALAAMVHDIGQVQVPAEIIGRPRPLIPEELALVEQHPAVGYDILKDIPFPWPVAEVVYQHHENIDGSGYPRGLVGDAILLEARILRVADAVEAMLAHRPFRRARSLDHVIAELQAGAGYRFDPKVVAVTLDLLTPPDQPMVRSSGGER